MDQSKSLVAKRKVLIWVLVSLLGLGLAVLALKESRKPFPISNYTAAEKSSETTVVIPSGATGDQIAQILFDAGVVKNARAFFAAATANERSASIQPGTYSINTRISGKEAVEQLLDSNRRLNVLLIREGERGYELRDDFIKLKYATNEIEKFFDEEISIPEFDTRTFEGFLYPATYNLTPGEGLGEVRERLLEKFNQVIKDIDFIARSKMTSYSPYEMLIVASIVQAEGYSESDFRKIARVIFNRLQARMPLQMDSTVLYALKERRIAVTKSDLSIASKYNSYTRVGLPPTPIGNPGKEALMATLTPEEGDWLYFVTVKPQVTKFTNSYSEFLAFKREFKANLKAGKFDGAQ